MNKISKIELIVGTNIIRSCVDCSEQVVKCYRVYSCQLELHSKLGSCFNAKWETCCETLRETCNWNIGVFLMRTLLKSLCREKVPTESCNAISFRRKV